jgi:hypothetical protein
MSEQITKINDRTGIGYGTEQRFIKGADPSKCLTNNEELSFDGRSYSTLASLFIQRDAAHYVFNGIASIKDILQVRRQITRHRPTFLFDQSREQ